MQFSYRKYNVEIVRNLVGNRLRWPKSAEADDETGLGLNRAYMDLRGFSWRDVEAAFARESELIASIENSNDPEQTYHEIEGDVLYEDAALFSLDLGMASVVLALSAAGCIPFSSCNAGAFGGHHAEIYPAVAFYARPATAKALLTCADESQIGFEAREDYIVAYSDDIRALRRFAATLIERKELFRRVGTKRKRGSPPQP